MYVQLHREKSEKNLMSQVVQENFAGLSLLLDIYIILKEINDILSMLIWLQPTSSEVLYGSWWLLLFSVTRAGTDSGLHLFLGRTAVHSSSSFSSSSLSLSETAPATSSSWQKLKALFKNDPKQRSHIFLLRFREVLYNIRITVF